MKKITIYPTQLFVLLFMLTATALKAQQISTVTDTTGITRLADDLSVSREKAMEIRQAMRYHQDELKATMDNTHITLQEKQTRLGRLGAERRRKIDAAMTPQQQALLLQKQQALLKKVDEAEAMMKQRQVAEKKQRQAGNE